MMTNDRTRHLRNGRTGLNLKGIDMTVIEKTWKRKLTLVKAKKETHDLKEGLQSFFGLDS